MADSSGAARAAERAIDICLDVGPATGPALESNLFLRRFATDDRLEGITAFAEKRAPKFTGG